ncbi:MAG: hypothetical protein AAFX40_07720 [Cyanobacteria bacterium J06639_1]
MRLLVWLVAEIALNLFGLDDLADASEFVFRHREPTRESQLAYVRVFADTAAELDILHRHPRLP